MDFYGHINLRENEMQRMAFGAETDFPVTPIVGRMVFKDLVLYMCVALNGINPIWIPLNSINTYHHTQSTVSTTWTIVHSLSSTTPAVNVYTTLNSKIIPDSIVSTDANTTVITFSTAIAGKAIVKKGDEIPIDGIGILSPDLIAYTESFTSQATIVSRHNLGYYPIIRVFIGDSEVNPANITHDSIYQATITFSSARTGTIRMV
jgi:hypothetical protein